ncbi:MAG: DUF262 domain-containing protein [Faunusvirus sp.]|jgi:hypothetical protein|uniref:DUF262 domain-containing protein n=1 Tax=Faunusvirus sp. TaxID=2487766 RepID=A0A3G5A2B4_9VIRU|nr:MAG: DUF262 domain-containing protein [Faunusvirus sp.]
MCDIDKWGLDDLIDAMSSVPTKKRKIRVPKFQRRKAWDDAKENRLIDSLDKNIPVGCLTLYKIKSDAHGCDYYLIIDGLQRSLTVRKYIKNPLQFENSRNIIKQVQDELTHRYPTVDKNKIDAIFSWWFVAANIGSYDDIIAKNYTEKFDDLQEYIYNNLGKSDTAKEIYKIIKINTTTLSNKINISKLKMPVLICHTIATSLYDVFDRLNTGGTPLKRHEICAAAWYKFGYITVKNPEIITHIAEHYDDMKKSIDEFEIHDDDTERKADQFTYHEYLMGLKGYINKKYELLNMLQQNSDEYIFHLVAVCLTKMTGADSDYETVPLRLIEEYKLDGLYKFEKQILKSVEIISQVLDPYIKIKTKDIPLYQVYALIGTIYNNDKYDIKQLQLHILHDRLTQVWKTQQSQTVAKFIKNNTYCGAISRKDYEKAFDDYSDNSLEIETINCSKITTVDKLFMHMLYIGRYPNYIQYNTTNDYDRVIGANKLKKLFRADDIKVSISHIANICPYINSCENKQYKTLYDFINSKTSVADKEAWMSYYFITDIDLKFINTNFNKSDYIAFLKRRFALIKTSFFSDYKM